MLDALPDSNLVAHRKALEAAAIVMSLVVRVPAPLKCLANRVIRSAWSALANLAEGHGRSGRDPTYHWRIASASAKEVDTHLRFLAHAKAIDTIGAETAVLLFDEVRAMTWRLLHPRSWVDRVTAMPHLLPTCFRWRDAR